MTSEWHVRNEAIRPIIARVAKLNRSRAKGKGVGDGNDAVNFVYALLLCQCWRIKKCTGASFNVDHVIPLGCGGKHAAWNLQVLPKKLNLLKGSDPNYKLPEPYRNS